MAASPPSRPASALQRAWQALEDLLRSRGAFAAGRGRVPAGRLLLALTAGGMLYGAVMGSSGSSPLQSLYSALKVPLLFSATLALCLPSFYAVNAVLGLAADFGAAVRGILSAQASLALALASLSPVTAFFYASTGEYQALKLFNGFVFALASVAAQQTLARHYRPLVAGDPRHRLALRAWPVLFVFVALQMAYALRPFVGHPDLPTRFFRPDWLGNVYIDLWWAARSLLG